MLYLSRLKLNARNQEARRDMTQPYELHRTIENAFHDPLHPDDRVLFRLDYSPRKKEWWVLVQSRYEPNWSFFEQPEWQGYLLTEPETSTFKPEFMTGGVYKFRLLANPTVKKTIKKEREDPRKTRLGLTEEADQLDWLIRKLEAAGTEVVDCLIVPHGLQRSHKGYQKQEGQQTHLAVLFEGVLLAKDPALLKAALQTGIGSAKGFGFGLLSLAPVRG